MSVRLGIGCGIDFTIAVYAFPGFATSVPKAKKEEK